MTLREYHPEEEEGGRRDEQERIDPVEHAAVARQHAAHVLDAQIALDEGLGEIAQGRRDRDDDPQHQPKEHAPRRRPTPVIEPVPQPPEQDQAHTQRNEAPLLVESAAPEFLQELFANSCG